MTTPVQTLNPVEFEAPFLNPAPIGLYAATVFQSPDAAPRWLATGVRIRPHNYGGEAAFGLWDVAWCGDPGDSLKDGERPELDDPFDPLTAWAFDTCDLTSQSQAEVRERVAQNLRLVEQTAIEREFAARLLIDAGTPEAAADIIAAVSHIEAEFAKTNTTGLIHASAAQAAYAQRFGLIIRSGGSLKSPLGHTWVFGGGYVEGLEDTLVGTSPTYGWLSDPVTREAVETRYNQFVAVAERSVVIGYEKAVAAATIGG
ncbi:major capsid pentamer protein [Gordonia phage NHagos]|nr:major capsid pentamer protein [Gordonia phage NHagos]